MNRIIIPVFYEGKFVSFQAADLTGKSAIKYDSAVNIKEYIYNLDRITKRMIITEGTLDSWRVGQDAVATFGTFITETQKHMIINKNLDKLIFCWDGEAYWLSRKWASVFMPFVKKVYVVALPRGQDPDSLGTEEVNNLINYEIERQT